MRSQVHILCSEHQERGLVRLALGILWILPEGFRLSVPFSCFPQHWRLPEACAPRDLQSSGARDIAQTGYALTVATSRNHCAHLTGERAQSS